VVGCFLVVHVASPEEALPWAAKICRRLPLRARGSRTHARSRNRRGASWPNTHRRLSPGTGPSGRWVMPGASRLTPYTFPNRVRVTQAQSTPSMVPDSYTGWAGWPTMQYEARGPGGPAGGGVTGGGPG